MTISSRTFRIFVSSTFSDLKAERDALQRKVFPKLRGLCLKHGCRFQAIDLRWGVSEEASLDQQTMRICLTELRRCQEVTPRPNFLVLLGDRYGWRPLPEEIPAAEFEEILTKVSGKEKELLLWEEDQPEGTKGWYRRDDNAVPSAYILQPRTSRFVDYDVWSREGEEPLRTMFHNAVQDMPLSPPSRLKYGASATEQEIFHGAFQIQDAREHIFCFFREIKELPIEKAATDPERNYKVKDFIDLDGQGKVDQEAQDRLQSLKGQLAAILPENLYSYEARWQGEREAPISTDHLERLCEDVYAALSRVIEAEIAQLEAQDALTLEVEAHKKFGKERARFFTGLEEVLQGLVNYLEGTDPHPLAIYGESGAGKSALLAKVALEAQTSYPRAVVIQRFIGTTPASSDIRLLLGSICREISKAYGVKDDDLPVEFRKLEEEIPRRLALGTFEKPLILILDALDQLSEAEQARRLYWLPVTLPPHVRLIVSALSEDPSPKHEDVSALFLGGLTMLKRKLPAKYLLAMDPMTQEEGGAILDKWLLKAGRTLQPHQREEVLSKFAVHGLPLYLRLAFEVARLWRSFETNEQIRLSPDINRVIRDLFRHLSQPAHHGEVLVSRSLGYLAAGKNGLAEDELLEVLSRDKEVMEDFGERSPKSPEVENLPVAVFSRLHFDLAPYLTERQADGATLLAFYHRQLREVVEEDYLSEPEKTARHAALACYFDSQPLYQLEGDWDSRNVRKISELPYQQTHGELWDDLEKKTLCYLRFIEAKCAAGMTYELIEDYNLGLASLPEAQPEIQKEQKRQARIKRFVDEMIAYARVWNEARDSHTRDLTKYSKPTSDSIPFPESIPCVKPWSEERTKQETERIINHPTRLDRMQAFGKFLAAEKHTLVKLGPYPGFCLQQAWNSATEGPVAQAAETLVREEHAHLLLLEHPAQRPPYQPQPALLQTLEGHAGMVNSVAFTPDFRRALSGGFDKTLRLWDLETGACLQTLTGHVDEVNTVALTLDGRRALSGSGDKTLRLWDLDTGVCLQTLEEEDGVITSVDITPDGRLALSGGQDFLRLWDLETGACLQVFRRIGWVKSVALTSDGRRALTGSGGKNLRLWDLERGVCLQTLKGRIFWLLRLGVTCVALTPDGRRAISGSGDKNLRLWDLKKGACLQTLEGHTDTVTSVAVTPDGRLALSGSWDKTLRLWDLDTGVCLQTLGGHTQAVTSVALTPDGRRALSGGRDNSVRLWDLKTGSCLQTLEDYTGFFRSVAITPDSRLALSGCYHDNTLWLWDLESGACIRTLEGHTSEVLSAALTPDGRRALSGSMDFLLLWDLESGACLQTMEGHTQGVASVALTPDGRRALSGSYDNTLRLWDLDMGVCLQTLEGHAGTVTSVDLTPDGRRALSGSWDKTLRLWDLDTGAILRTLEGHTVVVTIVALTPDGRRALSGSGDKTLRLWDLNTGACLQTLEGHTKGVASLALSPDGCRALSRSYDKTLRLWDLDTGVCLAGYQPRGLDPSLSTIKADGQLVLGTSSGKVIYLRAVNFFMQPPLTTPVRLWRWDIDITGSIGRWDCEITCLCLWCGQRFLVSKQTLEVIRAINQEAGLTPDQSPCLSLPDEAWKEPRLLSECPLCHNLLKFNPFIVDNLDRY